MEFHAGMVVCLHGAVHRIRNYIWNNRSCWLQFWRIGVSGPAIHLLDFTPQASSADTGLVTHVNIPQYEVCLNCYEHKSVRRFFSSKLKKNLDINTGIFLTNNELRNSHKLYNAPYTCSINKDIIASSIKYFALENYIYGTYITKQGFKVEALNPDFL